MDKKYDKIVALVKADYEAGKISNHDDLLCAVDEKMNEVGLNPVDDNGDAIVDHVKSELDLVICDRCGAVIKGNDAVEVGEARNLRIGLIAMSRAGETDYLRDNVLGAETVCKPCQHEILDYTPKFRWAGSVYASQQELERDVKRFETFKDLGTASLDELPRPLRLELKQRELDTRLIEERDETSSYEEMACADYLVSDDELEEELAGRLCIRRLCRKVVDIKKYVCYNGDITT